MDPILDKLIKSNSIVTDSQHYYKLSFLSVAAITKNCYTFAYMGNQQNR